MIHETAEIHPSAKIGKDNVIGPFVVVEANVSIGDGNTIGAHAVIGAPGQWRGKPSKGSVEIGDRNVIGPHVRIHRGMIGPTVINHDCYIMAGSQIDHNCVLEDGVTLCANVSLAGDVYVQKHATLGMGAAVHQKQTIGAYAMVGMNTAVPKWMNIEPGEKYASGRHLGRNVIGLRAHQARDLTDAETQYWLRRPKRQDAFKTAVGELSAYMKSRSSDYRERRYEIVRDVIGEIGYLREDDAAQLYNMAFSLLWQQHEDFKADQIFIRELLIDAVTGGIQRQQNTTNGKVGWLLNHAALGTYAPYKHVHAYLSGMEPCEVIIHGSVRSKEANELLRMGHNVHHVQGPCSEVTGYIGQICKDQGIGVLISDIYLAVPLFAFKKRVAPIQAYLSPGFQLFPADVVLLPETQEPIDGREPLEPIPTAVLREHLYQPVARKKPGRVFGVLSRAEKCSPDYWDTVVKILESTQGSKFLFFGRGEPRKHPQIEAKGVQNAHEALGQIDVYLDTFPTCGGLSVYEAMAHNIPVITLQHPSVASWNRGKPCVVNTEDEYIAAAQHALGKHGIEIAERGQAFVDLITDIPRGVNGLYKALENRGWQR